MQRADFDKLLADEAARQGVEIRYEHEIVAVDVASHPASVTVKAPDGAIRRIDADFILDASGFGRTLPRLLDLETPSDFPVRHATFTHVADGIADGEFDRAKIRVTVHPEHQDVWYWLIPFANGRSSLGVVARQSWFADYAGDAASRLRAIVAEDPGLARLLRNARWDTQVREIGGYAANVRTMHGPRFALLGNAAEFLDPVFSSGVTIAMRSASMAANCIDRASRGTTVDWEREFAQPLRRGVDTFRAYVEAWYDGRFQSIIFHHEQHPEVRRMISSILAGYAWDESNPFVANPARKLEMLAHAIRP